MAEALKTKGLEEIRAFKQRVIRQYSRDYISRSDQDKLVALVDQIEAHIIGMDEVIPARFLKRKAGYGD